MAYSRRPILGHGSFAIWDKALSLRRRRTSRRKLGMSVVKPQSRVSLPQECQGSQTMEAATPLPCKQKDSNAMQGCFVLFVLFCSVSLHRGALSSPCIPAFRVLRDVTIHDRQPVTPMDENRGFEDSAQASDWGDLGFPLASRIRGSKKLALDSQNHHPVGKRWIFWVSSSALRNFAAVGRLDPGMDV